MSKLEGLMRVARVLQDARNIIAKRWTKGHYVSDKDNKRIQYNEREVFLGVPDEDDGYHYCGDGALRRAMKNELLNWNETQRSKIESLLYDAQKCLSIPVKNRMAENPRAIKEMMRLYGPAVRRQHYIWCFNDLKDTSQEVMLECYDEAIADQCKLVQEEASRHPPPQHDGGDEQS